VVSDRVGLPALLAALALIAPGCGAGGSSEHVQGAAVRISERDFKIMAPRHLRAGEVDLAVHNRGPDAHELIAVRTGSERLPLRSDGSTVDEEALKRSEAGALEPGQPGALRHLRVHLRPGRYELFCNMAGHYLGGMHVRLVVQ
jgi:uncharacterized cupredoxin-like copper-binding protein